MKNLKLFFFFFYYISFDFDQAFDGLHSLVTGFISDTFVFNVAVPFNFNLLF